MHLREEEQILKVYHHHPTPFVFDILKVFLGTFPFFLVIFLFKESVNMQWYILLHIIVFILFTLVVAYVSLVFWLDKLIITNQRIIFVNWRYLTVRDEVEAYFNEIQEINTEEKGFLSYFKAFDYGNIRIETAASHVSIDFLDAPDPEGIRRFIYHVKPQ